MNQNNNPNDPIYDPYYEVFFNDDRERYLQSYAAYQQFVALYDQEAEGSSSHENRTRAYIPREREEAEQRLIEDYFGDDENDPKYIEKKFKQFRPTRPYSYEFKDVTNLKQYEKEAKWKQIITFSAILIIFISCIGLFGLATLSAEKRTKEIGIRKVLGASSTAIVTMLTKDFLKLVLISVIIAFPIAWFLADKFLEDYPYRIQLNGWMFGLVALVLVFITILTISYQALKSALANPVESLRTE